MDATFEETELEQGRSAEDLVIEVPPGTLIIDAKEQFTLKDLKADGESVVAARGGMAGRGNQS